MVYNLGLRPATDLVLQASRRNSFAPLLQIRVTEFMKQKGKFNYYPSEELRAHVVEFPYVGDDVSMMVILPPFDDAALFETVQKMTPATLRGVMAEVRSGFYEVRVALI